MRKRYAAKHQETTASGTLYLPGCRRHMIEAPVASIWVWSLWQPATATAAVVTETEAAESKVSHQAIAVGPWSTCGATVLSLCICAAGYGADGQEQTDYTCAAYMLCHYPYQLAVSFKFIPCVHSCAQLDPAIVNQVKDTVQPVTETRMNQVQDPHTARNFSTHPFLLGAYKPWAMKTHVRDTAAMTVTTQPDAIFSSRRPLTPAHPSHAPTPAIAPTVAGVELQHNMTETVVLIIQYVVHIGT